LKELALQISTDPEHKFDLALSLDDLDTAHSILSSSVFSTTITTTKTSEEITALAQLKWKALGDRALSLWKFDLAKECFIQAGDISSLLLIVLSIGDREGVSKVVQHASKSSYPHRATKKHSSSLTLHNSRERTKQPRIRRTCSVGSSREMCRFINRNRTCT